jgi:hypothetical protein
MEKIYPGRKKFGSGKNIPDPQNAGWFILFGSS